MDNSTIFSPDELIRYSRHFFLPDVGTEGQLKLKQARVLCIGAGGLASPVLCYLTAAGVGTIGIIDEDRVELSNLQRQVLFDVNNIGQIKSFAAKEKLEKLNPLINFKTYDSYLKESNASTIISEYDIIVDCTDNYPTRYLVNDVCFNLKKPNVSASLSQYEAQCSVFTCNSGPCYRCLYTSPPPSHLTLDCAEGGVLGVLPGLMGSIQATEVLKLILDIGRPLVGRLLIYNALEMQFREYTVERNPHCHLCNQSLSQEELSKNYNFSCQNVNANLEIEPKALHQLLQQQKQIFLLDVREPIEHDICHLNSKLIPLAQLESRYLELDPSCPTVVYCKVGGRSLIATKFLLEKGFLNVKNLKGGIVAWRQEIDQSLLLY